MHKSSLLRKMEKQEKEVLDEDVEHQDRLARY